VADGGHWGGGEGVCGGCVAVDDCADDLGVRREERCDLVPELG